jgi:hypothetical protein
MLIIGMVWWDVFSTYHKKVQKKMERMLNEIFFVIFMMLYWRDTEKFQFYKFLLTLQLPRSMYHLWKSIENDGSHGTGTDDVIGSFDNLSEEKAEENGEDAEMTRLEVRNYVFVFWFWPMTVPVQLVFDYAPYTFLYFVIKLHVHFFYFVHG